MHEDCSHFGPDGVFQSWIINSRIATKPSCFLQLFNEVNGLSNILLPFYLMLNMHVSLTEGDLVCTSLWWK